MSSRVSVAYCPLTDSFTTLWFPDDGGSPITAEIVGVSIARRLAPREQRLAASVAARDALRAVDSRLHVEAVGFSTEGRLVELWVAGRVRHLRELLHTARHDHWLLSRRLLRRLDDHAAVARVRVDEPWRVVGLRFEMERLLLPQRRLLLDQAREEGGLANADECHCPSRRVAISDASKPLSFVTTGPACLLVDLHDHRLDLALEWRARRQVHPAARLLTGGWKPAVTTILDEGVGQSGTFRTDPAGNDHSQAPETATGTDANSRK